MSILTGSDDYLQNVIGAGDEISENFKDQTGKANSQYSWVHEQGMLQPDNSLQHSVKEHATQVVLTKETIDGVGTKVEIYMHQFENEFQKMKKDAGNAEGYKNTCIELCYRMMLDLVAMNVDDLRNGELGATITDIIDINHLKGERGKLFKIAMSEAMVKVIKETKLAVTAGETAVLGEPSKVRFLYEAHCNMCDQIEEVFEKAKIGRSQKLKDIKEQILVLMGGYRKKIDTKMEEISMNIGGTALGLQKEEKLVKMEAGDVVIGFQERPTEDGIIGPRANGITVIRERMEGLLGRGWEGKTFEEFCEVIGPEKVAVIPEEIKKICAGKEMRDIATGRSTIFNPFVAGKLLGGYDSSPEVDISSLIHVTGGPLNKIAGGIKDEHLVVELDVSSMPIPPIFVLMQIAFDLDDEWAMNKWNMGMPYAITCRAKDVEKIILRAQKNGLTAQVIGTVHTKDTSREKHTIQGVGLGKSSFEFGREKKEQTTA